MGGGPKNVKIINLNLLTLKELVVKNTGIENISLEHPYRCCDLKPLYGIIFRDYIKQYESLNVFAAVCTADKKALSSFDILTALKFCLLSNHVELLKDYYEVKEVIPFDMFPRTSHVETICALSLKVICDEPNPSIQHT